jgi:hypothetical protein
LMLHCCHAVLFLSDFYFFSYHPVFTSDFVSVIVGCDSGGWCKCRWNHRHQAFELQAGD